MNNKKNLISALIVQIIHIIYGLLVPRIILDSFGSDVNGLVSSINQFLSFITLLEGGLGAVVLAELYSPIEQTDSRLIRGIMTACQKFFSRLAILFTAYSIILAIIYSIAVRDSYNIEFTFTLVLILSLTTIAQYLFSITYKLYLQANQKIFIINNISSIILITNVFISILVVKVFPEIRVLKLASSIVFFIQPIVLRKFVDEEYRDYRIDATSVKLKNKWNGFAQNLSFFVNMNTDIVLLTVFTSFVDVSIYSVYCIAINAIKSIISSLTNSYQSALGKYIAQDNVEALKTRFSSFCKGTWIITTILFSTCLLLVNQFIAIYTKNVNDANYYQPYFALIMTLANIIYCVREPYRLLVYAAGKFKETNFASFAEAFINIVLSLLLIKPLGLLGVAIGTLIAVSYRLIYFIAFLSKEIIHTRFKTFYKDYVKLIFIVIINIVVYLLVPIRINDFFEFIIFGIVVVAIEFVLSMVVFYGISGSISTIRTVLKRITF